MLKKRLPLWQWFSLFLFYLLLVLTKLDKIQDYKSLKLSKTDAVLGLTAVLMCVWTSSYAGVYYERLLKIEKMDFLLINVQISFYSFLFGTITCVLYNRHLIFEDGLFYGFSAYSWVYIFLSAFNGITIAFVLKYADSVLKSLAICIAILLSSLYSKYFFYMEFSSFYIWGTIQWRNY